MAQSVFSDVGSSGAHLCAQFVDALPIGGAAISVFGASLPETSICASDPLAARLDELQFDLGEGPRWEAARSRLPVHVPQVQHGEHPSWPVFAKALQDTGVEALFVFPLNVGALDVGIVELYSFTPGSMNRIDRTTASVLADSTAWYLLDQVLRLSDASDEGSTPEGSPLSRREIHQATGMVLAQARCTPTEALLLLRANAFLNNRSVRDVSRDVVSRTLDFATE